MSELLKLEFRKTSRQKWFYISIAIMIALLIIMAIGEKMMPSLVDSIIPSDPEELAAAGYTPEQIAEMKEQLNFGSDRGYFILSATSSAMYVLLSSVFIAIIVCEDYEQQIVKNIFSRGYSRRSVFLSKAICVFVFCTIIFIVIHLAAAVISMLILGMKEVDTAIFKNLGVVYLVCMAFNAMHLAISSIIRKAGSAIAISIVVPLLLSALLGVVQTLLKLEKPVIGDYWLESFLGPASSVMTSGTRLTEISIASCVYIVLFTFLGDIFGRKTEV